LRWVCGASSLSYSDSIAGGGALVEQTQKQALVPLNCSQQLMHLGIQFLLAV
jgi:hypothetical protein